MKSKKIFRLVFISLTVFLLGVPLLAEGAPERLPTFTWGPKTQRLMHSFPIRVGRVHWYDDNAIIYGHYRPWCTGMDRATLMKFRLLRANRNTIRPGTLLLLSEGLNAGSAEILSANQTDYYKNLTGTGPNCTS